MIERDIDKLLRTIDPRHAEGVFVLLVWKRDCSQAMKLRPVFEATAKDFPRAAFGEVENTEARLICAAFAIRCFPAVLVIRRGDPISQMTGYGDEAEFREWLIASFKLTGGVLEGS